MAGSGGRRVLDHVSSARCPLLSQEDIGGMIIDWHQIEEEDEHGKKTRRRTPVERKCSDVNELRGHSLSHRRL